MGRMLVTVFWFFLIYEAVMIFAPVSDLGEGLERLFYIFFAIPLTVWFFIRILFLLDGLSGGNGLRGDPDHVEGKVALAVLEIVCTTLLEISFAVARDFWKLIKWLFTLGTRL